MIFISGCKSREAGKEMDFENNIPLNEFLISEDVMPDDWEAYKPIKIHDSFCYVDCLEIQFDADFPNLDRAAQVIFVYETIKDAKIAFDKYVVEIHLGEKTDAIEFESSYVDQFIITCFTYEEMEYPVCQWSARYDNYLTSFFAWLIPDKMTNDQFENIIKNIDLKFQTILHQ
jgi:hypothetical protein